MMRGLLAVVGAQPLWLHHFNARILAWIAGSAIGYRRKVVMDNLTHAFPEKSEKEIRQICRKFYLHFADVLVEAIWFGAHKPAALRRSRMVSIANPEVIAGLREAAPSTMVMLSHTGNWELIGGYDSFNYTDRPTGYDECNIAVVYRRLSSRIWDNIMKDNRLNMLNDPEHFDGYLESLRFVRFATQNKDRNIAYHVITDQRPYFYGSDEVQVSFMGRPCRTMSASAKIARRYGYALCYMNMEIESRGHYVIRYTPICEDASKMELQEIMDRYYELLEADIRRQPENYLWTHKRWA